MKHKRMLLIAGGILAGIILIAGVRVGLLLKSISSYKNYWESEAVRPVEPGELVYIALGDSAAQGVGASSPQRGYVGLFAEYLAEETGKKVHVINISVSGAKLADAISGQLPRLDKLPKPDVVTIEIGANNVPMLNEQTFAREFAQVLTAMPKDTYVANMPSFNGGRAGKVHPKALSATNIINAQVGKRTDIKFADLYNATLNQGFLDFGADLFHPSNKGYKNWAKAFIQAYDASHSDPL